MPDYTTEQLVIDRIDTDYDTTADLTTAHLTAIITKVSADIDAAGSKHYWPFNAHDATVVTPIVIQDCATWLALARGLVQLQGKNANSSHGEMINFAFDRGELTLEQLRSGTLKIPPEKTSNETLTFGDGTQHWELQTDEAFMASTTPLDAGEPPNIFKGSVRISSSSTVDGGAGFTAGELADMRVGIEYKVKYRPEYARFVFHGRYGRLSDTSKVTTLKVTYHWDYQKKYADQGNFSGYQLGG